jgi:hypothetical protein
MSAFYWSSTSNANNTGNAWGVNFNNGNDTIVILGGGTNSIINAGEGNDVIITTIGAPTYDLKNAIKKIRLSLPMTWVAVMISLMAAGAMILFIPEPVKIRSTPEVAMILFISKPEKVMWILVKALMKSILKEVPMRFRRVQVMTPFILKRDNIL